MSTPTAAVRASTSVSTTPQFWERLWRTAGVQSVGLFVVAYFVYGNQPHVGASTEALVAFYQGARMRILIAAVLGGFAVLNLMWFAAALRTTLADAAQDGWGAAATASSATLGGLLMLLITVSAGLAYSIAGSGNPALLRGLNDFTWAGTTGSGEVGRRSFGARRGHAAGCSVRDAVSCARADGTDELHCTRANRFV